MPEPNANDKGVVIRTRLVRGTASNLVGKCINVGVWFVVTPVLVHQLGATEYGLWALVGTIVVYGALLDFGIGAAVSKYVAEYRASAELDEASRLVSTALWLYAGIGSVAALLGILLAPVFPIVFNVPEDARSTASWLSVVAGLTIAVELPTSNAFAVLRGLQRYEEINAVGIVAMLLLGGAMVTVALLGGGVVAVAAVNAPLALLMQVPMIWFIRRAEPGLRYGWRTPSRRLVRKVAAFSSSLFFLNTAERVNTKTDEFVIAAFLPVAAVTPYSVARRLAELPQVLTLQFVNLLLPLASELDAEGDRRRLRLLYLTATRVALVTYLPVAAGLMVFAEPFIAAWVGAGYAKDSIIVVILGFAGLFTMLAWPGNLMLQGMARHRTLAGYAVSAALLNLGLSIALIEPLGVKGVALATLFALGLQSALFVARAARINGLPFRELLQRAILPALFPAIPMLAVLFGLRALVDPRSLLSIAFVGAAGGAVYLIVYLWLGASPSEREMAHRLATVTSRRNPSTPV
jgi:O-antigen/teichoic acid export membrane protein